MIDEFEPKNMFLADEQNLDFIDDLFDDELFGSSVREEFDYETMQLLKDF